MVEPDDPTLRDRVRSIVNVSKSKLPGADRHPTLPLNNVDTEVRQHGATPGSTTGGKGHEIPQEKPTVDNVASEKSTKKSPSTSASSPENGNGEESASIEPEKKQNVVVRFYNTSKQILFSSYVNLLLVFVPVGIALNYTGVSPTVVFSVNAIAIIPLAALLSYATESVAASLGDTIGALLNVTFGNAVELIIFIALTKNEIRIVQASLLGSILSNLLLILGMCFLFGGLRFREQIYNSTVTQMSACLLSLAVTSLLLPTAFHASFSDSILADHAVLQISRGSSIILLLVYILYLLFQLKSHAYMYESTPQHVIDEESHPGVLADMLGSSSSSGTSSDTSSDESDATSGSNTTAKRIRRAFRGRRRRKSSVSSKETPSLPSAARTPSIDTFRQQYAARTELSDRHRLGAIVSGDEADADDEGKTRARPVQPSMTTYRDFESEQPLSGSKSPEGKPKKSHKRRFRRKHGKKHDKHADNIEKTHSASTDEKPATANAPRVAFTEDTVIQTENVDPTTKRPFTIRGLSRPTISKVLTQTVFSAANQTGATVPPAQPAVIPAPYGLRRASSLPDRLNRTTSASAARAQQQQQMPLRTVSTTSLGSDDGEKKHISRTAAVILLMISTALVAICAESLVGSINYLVDNTNVGQVFIGLIILPIVGNAAEHVTAVTMASKNKMDLAIGVAVGSSIQIALFVTPLIVLLGWILNKDMSLFFSLFETVALFVSAFIVNFLVLDGRSNYLEGALLIAAYVIIAVAAFFYPAVDGQSKLGGA